MIRNCTAEELALEIELQSIDLLYFDPPYGGVVNESWDNCWSSAVAYAQWLYGILELYKPLLTPTASVLFWGALGKHNHRPMYQAQMLIEQQNLLYWQDTITWKKRRAYGSHRRYLFTREELNFYTVDPEKWTFNIPLTNELRGYAGFNKKYPAKSLYKRVSNVWVDIPELMRPKRVCEKPDPITERVIRTHSNQGDLVCDPFCGLGTTARVSEKLGRRFIGCDSDQKLFG